MSTDMVVSKGPQVESPKSVLDVYKRTHSIYTQFSLVMWVVFFHPVSSFFFQTLFWPHKNPDYWNLVFSCSQT